MPKITVFTPTYNRGNLLRRVYVSLQKQTYKDFEWVIVDDGSTDETERIVNEFKNEAMFPVIYKKKKNEGKHIAINEGCRLARGEWFFIVDSDDYLTEDALDTVNYYSDKIKDNPDFAGVVGLRGGADGKAWTEYQENSHVDAHDLQADFLKQEFLDADFIEYKYIRKINGDRAEVVRTEILRKYPFPKFENEKFLVESYLWLTLANAGYIFRWFNKVIYITEYLEDGLTKNIETHYRNSPIGSYKVANLLLKCKNIPVQIRVRSIYHYVKYGRLAKINLIALSKECNDIVLMPIGLVTAFLKR